MKLHVAAGLLALLVVFKCASAAAQPAGGLPEQPNHIEYASPQAAMAALSIKPGVTMKAANGWVNAEDAANKVFWSFPPTSSSASPAVVKRVLYLDGNTVKVRMDVMCGGTKIACDQLVVEFGQLNAKLQERLSHMPGRLPTSQP
jgi:hypothetical protein